MFVMINIGVNARTIHGSCTFDDYLKVSIPNRP